MGMKVKQSISVILSAVLLAPLANAQSVPVAPAKHALPEGYPAPLDGGGGQPAQDIVSCLTEAADTYFGVYEDTAILALPNGEFSTDVRRFRFSEESDRVWISAEVLEAQEEPVVRSTLQDDGTKIIELFDEEGNATPYAVSTYVLCTEPDAFGRRRTVEYFESEDEDGNWIRTTYSSIFTSKNSFSEQSGFFADGRYGKVSIWSERIAD